MKTNRLLRILVLAGATCLENAPAQMPPMPGEVKITRIVEAPFYVCQTQQPDIFGKSKFYRPDPITGKCTAFNPGTSRLIGENEPQIFTHVPSFLQSHSKKAAREEQECMAVFHGRSVSI